MVGSAIKKSFSKNKKFNSNRNLIIFSPTRNELDLSNYNAVENWLKKISLIL